MVDMKYNNNLSRRQLKVAIDNFRYQCKLMPWTDPVGNKLDWLPKPFRTALVISADLELGWAWRYARNTSNLNELAEQAARKTRLNIVGLLEMFDHYEIPITWATIGHLFLDHCDYQDGKPHYNFPRPPYFENEFWSFQYGDWYDADPCSNLKKDPAWYAPDLIREIISRKTRHEIGCHTFSHINCAKSVCSPGLLKAELIACQELARDWCINLKSFVFPGNLPGNLQTLLETGIECYRLPSHYQLSTPSIDEFGLCAIPGGMQWEMTRGWTAQDWMKIIRSCLERALETNKMLHLWFHPSCDPIHVNTIFPNLLKEVQSRRSDIWVGTMGEVAELLKQKVET